VAQRLNSEEQSSQRILCPIQQTGGYAMMPRQGQEFPVVRRSRTQVGQSKPLELVKHETLVRLTQTGWGDGGQWDQAYAYFDRAWGNVLTNLQKRFAEGPVDWKPWLARLKTMQEEEERKKTR